MNETRDDRDPAAVAEELSETLDRLRDELAVDRPPRGPLGLPRPPTPREVLRFTDEAAIPAAIAVLEANVKTLELLQHAIRLADSERAARERGSAARSEARAVGRATLDRLDAALADVRSAVEDEPPDSDVRAILEEAHALQMEIDERLRRTRERDTSTVTEQDDSGIDIERELDSIRDEVRDGDGSRPDRDGS